MGHVYVYYKMIVPGGHHRQPRSDPSVSERLLGGGSLGDMETCTPPYFETLSQDAGSSDWAKLIYWSVTDGTVGNVYPPVPLAEQEVGEAGLVITAWYWPIGNGNGHPAIFVDAFSAASGGFIDDTFVDVPGSTALTTQANVEGTVLTTKAFDLVAYESVPSTVEPFRQWIVNGEFRPLDETTLAIARKATGAAIAVYQHPDSVICRPRICSIRLVDCRARVPIACPPRIIACRAPLRSPCSARLPFPCSAGVEPYCPAINPGNDPFERMEDFFRAAGVKNIAELAAKQATPKAKKAIARLSVASRKILKQMLKKM